MELLDYFPLHVPSNIYGLAHLAGERNRLLISTLTKRVCCLEVNDDQLLCNDIHFPYIPNGAEIISIAAFQRLDSNDVVVGVTYAKDVEDMTPNENRAELDDAKNEEFRDTKKENKYQFNIYSIILPESQLDLTQIAQDWQTFELDFVPTQLLHVRLDVSGADDGDNVLLLGGSDRVVHIFRENPTRNVFYEETSTVYPEFDNLQSVPLWIETITFPIDGKVYKYEPEIKNNSNESDSQHGDKSESGETRPMLQRSWTTEDSCQSKDDNRKKKERKGRTERRRRDKCEKKNEQKSCETYKDASRHYLEPKEVVKQTLPVPEFVRYTAITLENGTVRLCEVHYKNPHQAQVTRQWCDRFDCPVLSCRFFRDQASNSTLPTKLNNYFSNNNKFDEIHLLALNSIEAPVVYRNITRLGITTTNRISLPAPKLADIFIASFVCDFNFDTYNEILIGTFGNEVLAYKYQQDKNEYALIEQMKFRNPIHSLYYTDLTGNGIKELVVITSSGVVVQRHNLESIVGVLADKVERCLAVLQENETPNKDSM